MLTLFGALYRAGHKPFDLSLERLVAFLRVALTIFGLIEFAMLPGFQFRNAPIFALVFAPYILFGLVVLLLPTIGKFRTGWQLPVHLIDVAVASIFTYPLQPLLFPFFILYAFILLSATLRWNWQGALWTTVAVLSLQGVLFLAVGRVFGGFFIHDTFLSIIGGMFALFGASRQRSLERLNQIAAWPSISRQPYTDLDDHWLDDSLAHIARVMQVPRVLIVWEFAQERYAGAVLFADGKCKQDRNDASHFHKLVAAELEEATFASEAVVSKECLTLDGIKRCANAIVAGDVQDRYGVVSVCSSPFFGDLCKGRVFMLDRSDWGEDDLALAQFVASRLRIELEYYALYIKSKETAAARQRDRLARDLHDSVLQSLAAAGLQLKMIASRAEATLKAQIENVRKLLLGEQQSIRAFVDGRDLFFLQEHLNLYDEIQREIEDLKRKWNCGITLTVTPQETTIPVAVIRQIRFIITEAAANAVQHGKASRVTIAIERKPDCIHLYISDNGHGLKNTIGTYCLSDLAALGIGPQSIVNRITELSGTLSISSSSHGVEFWIGIPCDRQSAHTNTAIAHGQG